MSNTQFHVNEWVAWGKSRYKTEDVRGEAFTDGGTYFVRLFVDGKSMGCWLLFPGVSHLYPSET